MYPIPMQALWSVPQLPLPRKSSPKSEAGDTSLNFIDKVGLLWGLYNFIMTNGKN